MNPGEKAAGDVIRFRRKRRIPQGILFRYTVCRKSAPNLPNYSTVPVLQFHTNRKLASTPWMVRLSASLAKHAHCLPGGIVRLNASLAKH